MGVCGWVSKEVTPGLILEGFSWGHIISGVPAGPPSRRHRLNWREFTHNPATPETSSWLAFYVMMRMQVVESSGKNKTLMITSTFCWTRRACQTQNEALKNFTSLGLHQTGTSIVFHRGRNWGSRNNCESSTVTRHSGRGGIWLLSRDSSLPFSHPHTKTPEHLSTNATTHPHCISSYCRMSPIFPVSGGMF